MIFEEAQIGTIKLKNHILRSATHEGLADESGYPTEKLIKKYEVLAKNEVGCIITGYAGIMQNGKSPNLNMLMINDDSFIEPYKILTERIHNFNTSIILQIAHCGAQTRSQITGLATVAPSSIQYKLYKEDTPFELNEQEIHCIITNFVNSIVRAQKSGFDGVQLHIAHGYLLSQFLSSYTNRRNDKWGGSTANKFRIVQEIFDKAKPLVGDFPILVKLNAYDGRKRGMRLEEAIEIAKLLEKAGCSGIEVSCGVEEDGLFTLRGDKLPIDALFKFKRNYKSMPDYSKKLAKIFAPIFIPKIKPYVNYNVFAAEKIKNAIKIPVIVVGGIKSLQSIKSIIENKQADFVSMSRPLIAEPNLIKKFKNGTQDKSNCIDCNYCVIAADEETLKCYRGHIK